MKKKFMKRSLLIAALALSTIATTNVASADTFDINTQAELQSYVSSGTATKGRLQDDITLSSSLLESTNLNTITVDGYDGDLYGNKYGGFIFGSGSKPSITGMLMQDFMREDDDGAAIYNKAGSTLTVSGVKFIGNSAFSGGAIVNEGTLDVEQGSFLNNAARLYGGAIYNKEGSTLAISGTYNIPLFMSNSSQYGGAIVNEKGTISEIVANFVGNNGKMLGGAIYNEGTITSIGSDTNKAIFFQNTTSSEGHTQGGAIDNSKTIGTIQGYFANNAAVSVGGGSGYGGAISNSSYDYSATMTIKDSVFIDNYVQAGATIEGGAIYNDSKLIVNNSIFMNNYTTTDGGTTKVLNDIYNESNATNKGLTITGINFMTGGITGGGTTNLGDGTTAGILFLANGATLKQSKINFNENSGIVSTNGVADNFVTGGVLAVPTNADRADTIIDIIDKDNYDKFTFTDATNMPDTAAAVVLYNDVETTDTFKYINGVDDSKLTYNGSDLTRHLSPSATSDYIYVFNSNKSTISVWSKDPHAKTLPEIMQYEVEVAPSEKQYIYSYAITDGNDITLDANLGEQQADMFTLIGNGKTINGADTYSGIEIAASRVFALDDVVMKGFKKESSALYSGDGGSVIKNAGTITFIGGGKKVTFDGNKVTSNGGGDAYGAAIANTGTIYSMNADFKNNSAIATGDSLAKGGAISNNGNGIIASITGDFDSNSITSESTASSALNAGGAIYNEGKIGTIKGNYTNNTVTAKTYYANAGAINNAGSIYNIEGEFKNNSVTNTYAGGSSETRGGAIYNGSSIGIVNGTFESNFVNDNKGEANGGAIYNSGTTVNITGTFKNNSAISTSGSASGGAIYNSGTVKNITGTFENNSAISTSGTAEGGAIYNSANGNGEITLSNTTFKGNYVSTDGGTTKTPNDIFNSNELTFTGTNTLEGGIVSGEYEDEGITYIEGRTTIGDGITQTSVTLGNDATLQQNEVIVNQNAMLALGTRAISNFGTDVSTFTSNGGTLSMQNGGMDDLKFNNLALNGDLNMMVDADLANLDMDTISATSYSGNGNILVSNIKLLSDAPASDVGITFVKNADGLREKVQYTGEQGISYSPTYKYNVAYNPKTGMFNFTRGGASVDYNPAILASSVAAQAGAYLTQINTYEEAFANMDQSMLMTREQRTAMKTRNKYAAAEGAGGGVVSYSPNQFPVEDKGIWFRPFASFESVPLNNGPKVDNISYGGLIGADSSLIELKHGWDMVWGAYAGYNGSRQKYQGNSIYQNGGMLGVNAVWYKGDFFTGLTANVGASVADATTMYGREDMAMLSTGVASKTGYNWELFNSKLIVQPSFMMSYSFINTFDYTNAAGVSIHQDPLHAIQLVPGLKFIGNLPHGWQPYIGVSMIWNIMDKTHFYANDVSLPEMSVDPYVQYGVGVQKSWGEKFTGFGQVMMRNGGRNGVSLQAGFRWALGNNGLKTNSKAGVKTNEQQRKIKLSLK